MLQKHSPYFVWTNIAVQRPIRSRESERACEWRKVELVIMEPSELLEEWGLREYIAKFDGKSPFFH